MTTEKLLNLSAMQLLVESIRPGAGEKFKKYVTKKLPGRKWNPKILVNYSIIDKMMSWSDSPEGYEYWSKIHEALEEWRDQDVEKHPELLNQAQIAIRESSC